MEWPKLKNVILIILITVNLFLLVLVLQRNWESYRFSRSAREDIVAILWENGRIRLDSDILPGEMKLTPMDVPQDVELEEEQAAALLGQSVKKTGPLRYSGEKGSAQFYMNGEYSGEFAPGAYPLNGQDPGAFVLRILDKIGVEAEVLSVSGEDPAEVTVRQRWEGVPVFDCTSVFRIEGGELRAIQNSVSYRLVGEPQASGTEKPRKIATLLLNFLDYITRSARPCGEITGFTPGYRLDTQQNPAGLVPTWYVTTDQGCYYWNAMTGEITPEE